MVDPPRPTRYCEACSKPLYGMEWERGICRRCEEQDRYEAYWHDETIADNRGTP